MNFTPIESEESDSVLVCGECGRVNPVPQGVNRSTSVRCSGCGQLLRGERPRMIGVSCPKCQSHLEIDPAWVGHEVSCGSCGSAFVAERGSDFHLPAKKQEQPIGGPSGRVGRAEPALPETGGDDEVDDQRQAGKRVRRTRKKRRVKRDSARSGLRFALASILTFGAVIAVIVEVGRRAKWWLATPEPPAAIQDTPRKPAGIKKPAPAISSSELPALENCLRSFFAAANPQEMLPFVRDAGNVAARMNSHYERFPYAVVGMPILEKAAEQAVDQRLFTLWRGKTSEGRPLAVVVERLQPGKFLVDWDSLVRFSSISWESFVLNRPPQTHRFQAYLKRDFIGNPHYPIENHASYLLWWDDVSDGLPMFVPRDSPLDLALQAATAPQKGISPVEPGKAPLGSFPVTIEVAFPKAANKADDPPALELRALVHEGWVNPAPGDS